MQENDLKTIKLTIAGRVFPVKVTPEEETVIRDLERELNSKVMEFQNTYPGRDKLDCVLMTLLTYTFDQKKPAPSGMDEQVADKISQIKNILNSVADIN